jgi:lysophospholipase L1-like esterase
MGDSIAFNAPNDCPGCTGYVDQYGTAIAAATGKSVRVMNVSEHSGLTSNGLLADLSRDDFRASVAAADAITISIGFNDAPMLVNDDPCDGPAEDPQLETYTEACITAWADAFGQRYTKILDQVQELRRSKPTVVTVINIFDQWRGFADNSQGVAAHIDVVKTILEHQNARICSIAIAHGALCADLHSAFNGPHHDKPSGVLLGDDYAHPSQAGNDLIAKTLIQLGFGVLG